ncbi:hypothetical protein ACWD3J_45210 [Streptomyces sp. NPDC002755]|uniref:hypothetical protein n=1 Tax=Streptomyces sp. NPDC002884 TaxID=3154544 RepID=UPI00332D685B
MTINRSGMAVALNGFLYDKAMRGDRRETTARFRFVVSHRRSGGQNGRALHGHHPKG